MERCDGCGLRIEGGAAGCQERFDSFRAREPAEFATGYPSTRLTIDVYCLQHPDRYCESAKSLAAHLTGVGWALERGGGESGLRALQRWLNGEGRLEKPTVPDQRGELTVADLIAGAEAGRYAESLDGWARSTWTAYAPLHAIARDWIDTATGR